MLIYSYLVRYTINFFVLAAALLFNSAIVKAQTSVPPPNHIWFRLGYPASSNGKVDWNWLQKECANGHVLSKMRPGDAVVVPVFDDGRCFYTTEVAAFRSTNPQAVEDEKCLRQLLNIARSRKIRVFLALNLLEWQRSSGADTPSSWRFSPGLQETSSAIAASGTESLYASPFHPEVQSVLVSLIQEISRKFPDAAGSILDLHLSPNKIMGYSEASRALSIRNIGIDPSDLDLSGGLGIAITPSVQKWISWRNGVFLSLLKMLREAYITANPRGRVFISGKAGYPIEENFNALHSGQDWPTWLRKGLASGVLLEGNWSPASQEVQELRQYMNTNPVSVDSKHILVLPVVGRHGTDEMDSEDYEQEWSSLKSSISSFDEVVVDIQDESELENSLIFTSGTGLASAMTSHLLSGTLMPNWSLQDGNGLLWSSTSLRGRAMALVLAERPAGSVAPLSGFD